LKTVVFETFKIISLKSLDFVVSCVSYSDLIKQVVVGQMLLIVTSTVFRKDVAPQETYNVWYTSPPDSACGSALVGIRRIFSQVNKLCNCPVTLL